MAASSRNFIVSRAGNRCEYCQLAQEHDPFFRFQIEHIVPRQHGGPTTAENLALACPHCNLHKGPNLTGIDPLTGEVVRLFNPRTQTWAEHFQLTGALLSGRTDVGRTTIRVLAMNAPARVQLRAIVR